MRENEWTNSIKKLLQEANLGDNIYFDTLNKVPYAQEILSYDLDFKKDKEHTMAFETDLLVFEKKESIKPRIIIESKINSVTTHDAITYSYKAQTHKNVTPYIRYGIMLGNRKHYPLPGRLFRHGTNFDFMISFKGFVLSEYEKSILIELVKKEISYSRKIEEMIYESRTKNRKHYFLLQKELRLEEM
ncbi:hypothetical protein [Ureibacillus terrenus]|uniref:Uncharacterized protein n=1 Tax=Ureibacillus terrenus TaxID=118246 RepID=A0A540UUX3_9BACL|nr:hypothetical protein [Ureibacillus terrenus]TQE88296.1 hypothetical protein FKZ59_13910 [Ureibacillus terrenus]